MTGHLGNVAKHAPTRTTGAVRAGLAVTFAGARFGRYSLLNADNQSNLFLLALLGFFSLAMLAFRSNRLGGTDLMFFRHRATADTRGTRMPGRGQQQRLTELRGDGKGLQYLLKSSVLPAR